jgi:hypothetical protein
MIGKNKAIHRFVRGHIYEMTYGGTNSISVGIYQKIVLIGPENRFYQFKLLAKNPDINDKGILRLSKKTIHKYDIKELQVTDLPLYIGLQTYPVMEKLLREYKAPQT